MSHPPLVLPHDLTVNSRLKFIGGEKSFCPMLDKWPVSDMEILVQELYQPSLST